MEESASVEIRPDDYLTPVVRLSFPYAPDAEGFRTLKVEIEADGLRCDHGVMTLGGDGLDRFLGDLAADWRGWEGTRGWHALEDGMSIEATHRGGRVELLFTLRRNYKPDAWEVRLPILVAPGESLASIADQTARLLAIGLPGRMIDKNDLDVLVWRSDDQDRVMREMWVMLIHKQTGISAESREHPTQGQNYAAALAELERKVAERLDQ
jgi:hypothetical protein